MRDTPKTDAEQWLIEHPNLDREMVVSADFSRELERENARLRSELGAALAAVKDFHPHHSAFNHDYDNQMKDCLICQVMSKHAAIIALAHRQEKEKLLKQANEWTLSTMRECRRADEAERKLAEAERQLENERQKVAGCSTAALGYWKEGDSLHPDYECTAIHDVASLYQRMVEAERKLKEAQEALHPSIEDDAYYNLAGALEDLKHQGADKVCVWTIERVLRQIGQCQIAIAAIEKEGG